MEVVVDSVLDKILIKGVRFCLAFSEERWCRFVEWAAQVTQSVTDGSGASKKMMETNIKIKALTIFLTHFLLHPANPPPLSTTASSPFFLSVSMIKAGRPMTQVPTPHSDMNSGSRGRPLIS